MDDNVNLKLAIVEGAATKNDNRLSVRVLPDLETITEPSLLPRWPSFFRTSQITGAIGETVWVICNKELTVGYILGRANYFSWTGNFEDESISAATWDSFGDIYLNRRGKILNYSNLEITFWNQNAVHFVERESGSAWIIQSSGIIHQVGPDDVHISVGDSIFEINSDEINLSAKVIRLGGEVRLGKNPTGKVMRTPGHLARNSEPAEDVWA